MGDGMAGHGRLVLEIMAVDMGIDLRGLHRGVQRLDMQAHGIQLGLDERDLVVVHLGLGLGEIEHCRGVGLQFLGTGEPQLGLAFLDL